MSSYVATLTPMPIHDLPPSFTEVNVFPLLFIQWGLKKLQHTSLVAQMVKNLPPMREIQVSPLGQEEPVEKEMTTNPVVYPENPMDRGAWKTAMD